MNRAFFTFAVRGRPRLGAREIAIDRWGATGILTRLHERRLPVVQFGQGFASMSTPCKENERDILGRKIRAGGDPVLRRNSGNVRIEPDAAGNFKLAKHRALGKIDDPIAVAMAIGRALANEAEPSAYEAARPAGFLFFYLERQQACGCSTQMHPPCEYLARIQLAIPRWSVVMVEARHEFARKEDVTPEFVAAVVALRKLPADMRTKAFAEAAHESIRDSAACYLGQRSEGRISWRRMLGQRHFHDDLLPTDDHRSLWSKEGQLTYVSQPYPFGLEQSRAMVLAADEYGLTFRISAGSWHNPMSTLLATWQKAK